MTFNDVTTAAFFDELEKIGHLNKEAISFTQGGKLMKALKADVAKPIAQMPAGPMAAGPAAAAVNPAKARMQARFGAAMAPKTVGGRGLQF
jgi:hypothetical protein